MGSTTLVAILFTDLVGSTGCLCDGAFGYAEASAATRGGGTMAVKHPSVFPLPSPIGDESVVEWVGKFEPKGSPEEVQKTIQGIYEAGFDNLRKMFGQFGAASAS